MKYRNSSVAGQIQGGGGGGGRREEEKKRSGQREIGIRGVATGICDSVYNLYT